MNRKIVWIITSIVFTIMICSSCNKSVQKNWENEKDSIMTVNQQQQQVVNDMTSTVVLIASSLDSIAKQEEFLRSGVDENGYALSRKTILENLTLFENLLTEQRNKLKKLETAYNQRGDELKKMSSIIKFLNEELVRKDETIQQLKGEVASKNTNIKQLNSQLQTLGNNLSELSDSLVDLNQKSKNQKQILSEQESAINTVYYVIGNKKELVQKGILTAGKLFSKSSIDYSALDKSMFIKGDIRKISDIRIVGESPKVLSNIPNNSYSINSDSKRTHTLHIYDTNKFWEISKFLIIQIK